MAKFSLLQFCALIAPVCAIYALPSPAPAGRTSESFDAAEERAAMKAAMERLGGNVPSRSSYFGIVDLAGFPKNRFYLYQSRWRPDLPMAHLLPHWTWPGREGEVTPVHLYTSGDEAELFLNGKSLGRRKRGAHDYRLRWDDVLYESGELKAVAYRQGRPWAEAIRRTAGPAAGLELTVNCETIRADGGDLAFITMRVVDANGNGVPEAKPLIKFSLEGPADIAGLDNGDATSLRSFQGREMAAFSGQCLAIVRSRAGVPGTIELTATAADLPAAKVRIAAELEKAIARASTGLAPQR